MSGRGAAPVDRQARTRRSDAVLLRVPYGPDYDVPQLLRYLGRDAHSVAERLTGNRFERYLTVGGRPLRVMLRFEADACHATPCSRNAEPLSAADAAELRGIVAHILGLGQPVAAFRTHVAAHPVMGPLAAATPGLRVPQVPGMFEALCWAVIGQQINLAFAFKLRNRLIALSNGADPDTRELLPFPAPEQVVALQPEALRAVQFSRQKCAYLLDIAAACATGRLDEASLSAMPADQAQAALQAVRGVGPWSAAYVGMRALGHADALPVGDAGLQQALRIHYGLPGKPDAATQLRLFEPFRPFRSLACYHLWRSLSKTTDG